MLAASYLGYATLTGEGIEPVMLRAELAASGPADWGGTLMPKEGERYTIKPGHYRLEMPDGRSSAIFVQGMTMVTHGGITRQEFRVRGNGEPPPFDHPPI